MQVNYKQKGTSFFFHLISDLHGESSYQTDSECNLELNTILCFSAPKYTIYFFSLPLSCQGSHFAGQWFDIPALDTGSS